MSFTQENGYIPVPLEEIISDIREGINSEFSTTFTPETFVGTGWYKYAYVIAQKMQREEVKKSEIFAKVKEYIASTNLRIQRPSVSYPGILDTLDANGWMASVKNNLIGDAGTISICVDVDQGGPNYPAQKLAICTIIKDFTVGGMISMGTESETILLSNGQSFPFKFFLPDYISVLLRITLHTSSNRAITIPSDEDIRQTVYDNIYGGEGKAARYRLGWNFEPQRYFEIDPDATWAESVKLEYSTNGGSSWTAAVFTAAFDDYFDFDISDIEVVIDP